MDIRQFPFDLDALDFNFDTYGCTFSTLGHTRKGAMAFTRTYELSPVTNNAKEGLNILMRWNLQVPGWDCYGWAFSTKPYVTAAGAPNTAIKFSILFSRYSWYYVRKIVLPFIAMTIILALAHCGDHTEFYDRLGFVSTMFLANVAVMLVIGEHLPKTNFITYAEQLAIVSTSLTAVDCLIVAIAYIIDTQGLSVEAFWFDKIAACSLMVAYVVYTYVTIISDKLGKQRRMVKELDEFVLPAGFLRKYGEIKGDKILQFYGSVKADTGEQHHEIHVRAPLYEHQHKHLSDFCISSGLPRGDCKLRNSTVLVKEK